LHQTGQAFTAAELAGQLNYGQAMAAYRACLRG
jgi:hypothetical protein